MDEVNKCANDKCSTRNKIIIVCFVDVVYHNEEGRTANKPTELKIPKYFLPAADRRPTEIILSLVDEYDCHNHHRIIS